MSVTIKDVAQYAGVGVGTVSRVLNETGSVKATTKAKVLAAIADLDYVPNENARRLSNGRTMTIGVIAPFFTSQSVVERLRGIETVIGKSDYDLVIYNNDSVDRLNKYTLGLIRQERVDGLLIISMKSGVEAIDRLNTAPFPTVIIDAENEVLPSVSIDDIAGGMLATSHLIQLGHREIGFVSDVFYRGHGNDSSEHRFIGYKKSLKDFGLNFNPAYTKSSGLSRQDGYQMTKELLQLEKRPTAIVAASDVLATGVIQAAKEFNLNVPYDLSIIGYDDIELAEFMNLTTIRQPLFNSGKIAADMLLSAIGSENGSLQDICLPIEVVIRGTTARPPR